MTITTVSAELDTVLMTSQEKELLGIAVGDPLISHARYNEKRRELIVELVPSAGHEWRLPDSIHAFLYRHNVGHTLLRPVRKAA